MEPTALWNPRRIGGLTLQHLRRHSLHLRHHREQRAGVRVPGVVEQLLGRALLDDPAEVHHGDPVGDVPGEAEIVRDDENRDTGLPHEAQHQLEDLAAHRRVEARHRLVRHDQLWPERHRTCNHDALALPARHLVGIERHEPLGRP